MEEKQCQYCRNFKSLSKFSLNKSRKDGLQKYCKECNKQLNRKYKERKAAKAGRVMKAYEPKQYSTVTSEKREIQSPIKYRAVSFPRDS